ncbi:MAG: cell division protein FtsL [Gemmatimonadetes bacterium]|nr:cell division protein FtsL [Gemmatimonadota bacterium]
MTGRSGTGAVALALASLLAALGLVAWRQARARELLGELARVRSERALAEAELTEQVRRVQRLESRARVVPEARHRLGMHLPSSAEIVILSEDRS